MSGIIPAGWGVFCGKRLYFPRTFSNKEDAEAELEDMLRIYPKDSVWRQKLRVEFHGNSPSMFDPPFGLEKEDSKEGVRLVSNTKEQMIIKIIKGYLQTGNSLKSVALILTEKGFSTRAGRRIDSAYVESIILSTPIFGA